MCQVMQLKCSNILEKYRQMRYNRTKLSNQTLWKEFVHIWVNPRNAPAPALPAHVAATLS